MRTLKRLAPVLLTVVLVKWTFLFSPSREGDKSVEKRHLDFKTEEEADRFIKGAPKDQFECTNSVSGEQGFCEIKEMQKEVKK